MAQRLSTTTIQSSLRIAGLLACAVALAACGTSATGGDDNADVALLDTSAGDSGFDTTEDDVQPTDTGGVDTNPEDTGPDDIGPDDAALDTDPTDVEQDTVADSDNDVQVDPDPADGGPDDVDPVDTSPDVPPMDVGPDVPPMDVGPDVPPMDVSPDVPPMDVGPDVNIICNAGGTSCDGDTLVSCSADGTEEARQRCQPQDAFCGREGGVASCIDWFCEPEATRCDGDSLFTCDSRGFDELVIDCENGCDAAAGQCADLPVPECDDPNVTPLVEGVHTFTLCGAGDEYDNTASAVDCGDFNARGEDVVFSITLTEPSRVRLQLVDFDAEAAVDTILYIRTDCAIPESQFICGDDTPCDEADNMNGCFTTGDGSSFQPRESNIDIELEAGTYYVVADQFNLRFDNGSTFSCGTVRLDYQLD